MANVYKVHMWLTFSPYDANGETEFQKRFPKSLALYWWNQSYQVDNTAELASELNEQILSQCKSWLDDDRGQTVTDVTAFSDSVWTQGSGGQHESLNNDIITTPSSIAWTFDYNSSNSTMLASARWIKET